MEGLEMKSVDLRKVAAAPIFALALALMIAPAAFADVGEGEPSEYTPPTQEEINEMWAAVDEICDEQLVEESEGISSTPPGVNRAAAKAGAVGTYPGKKGYILVTKDPYGKIPTGHAAIIYSKNVVVEALGQGVVSVRNDWKMSKRSCYGVQVLGASSAKQQ